MRISDWSSDVCSSDLVAGLFALRSRVFTLIDPHVVVGLPPVAVAQGQRVMVVDVADHGYALIADETEDVCFIETPETRIAGRLSSGGGRVADGMKDERGGAPAVGGTYGRAEWGERGG